jgi:hypothetical protein
MPKPEIEEKIKLRTVSDLTDAHEWLFNQQRSNAIDAKTADALNTTLKGAVYLRAKLRLDAAKIVLQAQIKKITVPDNLLPEM